MEIIAYENSFALTMFQSDNVVYATEKKRPGLWVSTKKEPARVGVRTHRGQFIEVVNKAGEILQSGGDGGWFYVEATKAAVFLRHKKLPDPALTKAELDKAREKVERVLCSDMPHSLGIPDNLEAAIAWFQKKLAKIPAPCRASASVSFRSSYSHGESYDNIEISYDEPESDKEVIARIQIDRERKRVADAAELAKFQQLKTKFCK